MSLKIMEKKKYYKPEVKNTELDSSINLVLMSENAPVGDPTPNDPGGEETVTSGTGFFNPFKWFK